MGGRERVAATRLSFLFEYHAVSSPPPPLSLAFSPAARWAKDLRCFIAASVHLERMQIKISLPSELVDTYRGWNGEKELLSSTLARSYVYNAPLCGGLLPRSILLLLLLSSRVSRSSIFCGFLPSRVYFLFGNFQLPNHSSLSLLLLLFVYWLGE